MHINTSLVLRSRRVSARGGQRHRLCGNGTLQPSSPKLKRVPSSIHRETDTAPSWRFFAGPSKTPPCGSMPLSKTTSCIILHNFGNTLRSLSDMLEYDF